MEECLTPNTNDLLRDSAVWRGFPPSVTSKIVISNGGGGFNAQATAAGHTPAIATVGTGRCFSAWSLKIGQPDVTVMAVVVLRTPLSRARATHRRCLGERFRLATCRCGKVPACDSLYPDAKWVKYFASQGVAGLKRESRDASPNAGLERAGEGGVGCSIFKVSR